MMEFTFEESPWEQALGALPAGETIDAAQFLALMEGEEEEAVEEALAELERRGIGLDVSGLPAVQTGGELALRLRQEQQLVQKDSLLESLEDTDPLRLYLEELARTPAAGDEDLLAQRCAQGDEGARSPLVNRSLHRVVELAKEMTGRGVLLLDLIQEGSLGLWQGIMAYRGGDFSAHRDWWIRQYLARAVVLCWRSSGVGQKLRQGMEDYRDVDQRLLAELGRNPTLEEIAEAMHVTEADAAVYAGMLDMARTRQRVDSARKEPEPTAEDEQAVENTAYFQSRQRIMELLSVLSTKEAELLTLRFGLEGGLPLSPEDTGKKLGMTPQEVVELEAAALAKLRNE